MLTQLGSFLSHPHHIVLLTRGRGQRHTPETSLHHHPQTSPQVQAQIQANAANAAANAAYARAYHHHHRAYLTAQSQMLHVASPTPAASATTDTDRLRQTPAVSATTNWQLPHGLMPHVGLMPVDVTAIPEGPQHLVPLGQHDLFTTSADQGGLLARVVWGDQGGLGLGPDRGGLGGGPGLRAETDQSARATTGHDGAWGPRRGWEENVYAACLKQQQNVPVGQHEQGIFAGFGVPVLCATGGPALSATPVHANREIASRADRPRSHGEMTISARLRLRTVRT